MQWLSQTAFTANCSVQKASRMLLAYSTLLLSSSLTWQYPSLASRMVKTVAFVSFTWQDFLHSWHWIMRSSSSMLFQIFGVNAHSQFPRLLHSYHAAYSWRWRCHFLCDTFNCQLSYIFCLRLDFMAAGTLPDRCCPGCTVLSISKWYSPGRQPSPVKTSGYSSSI